MTDMAGACAAAGIATALAGGVAVGAGKYASTGSRKAAWKAGRNEVGSSIISNIAFGKVFRTAGVPRSFGSIAGTKRHYRSARVALGKKAGRNRLYRQAGAAAFSLMSGY